MAMPTAICHSGVVAGQASRQPGGPAVACVWNPSRSIEYLPPFSGTAGCVHGINSSGVGVGTSTVGGRSLALRWANMSGNSEPCNLGARLPLHSAAYGINDSGVVVGWSSIDPTQGEQRFHRPTVWLCDGTHHVLSDLAGRWGEAIAINERGSVLVVLHDDAYAQGAVWGRDGIVPIERPSEDTVSFWPVTITHAGTVLGNVVDRKFGRAAVLAFPDGRRYKFGRGTQITAATDQMVVGFLSIDGIDVPWAWKDGEGEAQYLPHFNNHYTRPTAIGPQGWIAGVARGDHCHHPLLWTPSAESA